MGELTTIDKFKSDLTCAKSVSVFESQLPSDIPVDRFTNVVIRAVTENPELLNANRKSLFTSCSRAAQDGLIPDGREGALVVYNTKGGDGQWHKHVQWQPMISGLRKRLAERGFSIRAEVVYENDEFIHEMGDDARIIHRPPPLGTERGNPVGAYAIATGPDGDKYREVMSLADLEKVRASSKAQNGPWAKWTEQMYRKTVAKRLINWLPLPDDERLKGLVERDNEQYIDGEYTDTSKAAKEVQEAARRKQEEKPAKSRLPRPKVAATDESTDAEEEGPQEDAPEAAKPKKKAAKRAPKKRPPKPVETKPVEGELVDDEEEPAF